MLYNMLWKMLIQTFRENCMDHIFVFIVFYYVNFTLKTIIELVKKKHIYKKKNDNVLLETAIKKI